MTKITGLVRIPTIIGILHLRLKFQQTSARCALFLTRSLLCTWKSPLSASFLMSNRLALVTFSPPPRIYCSGGLECLVLFDIIRLLVGIIKSDWTYMIRLRKKIIFIVIWRFGIRIDQFSVTVSFKVARTRMEFSILKRNLWAAGFISSRPLDSHTCSSRRTLLSGPSDFGTFCGHIEMPL